MTSIATHTPVLMVNGAALPERWLEQLTGLRVERALGLVGQASIRFTDPGYGLSTTNLFSLGQAVVVKMPNGDVLIDGQVTGVTLDQSDSGDPDLVVVVRDLAHRLTRGTVVQTFRQVTISDVISKIALAAGLRNRVAATSGQFPYLMQNGSDLAFLNELTERSGTLWWMDGSTLVVEPPDRAGAPIIATLGEQLTEFSVQASGLRPDEVKVSGWSSDTKQGLLGVSRPPDAPPSDFVKQYGSPQRAFGTKATVAAANLGPADASDANRLADALLQVWSAAAIVGRGSGPVNSALRPGVRVQVRNAGPASGTYLVSSVEHVYGQGGLTTRFVTGHNRPAGLVDTLGASPRAADVGGGFSVSGLVVGLVSNINDTDGTGRVRVKYGGLAGEVESEWARVLSVGGGPNRGVVFHPEINDEVLVGFEHGDPRRPVVLGGLFSKKTAPPWKPQNGASDVQARRISSRLGHFMEMGDGKEPTTQHLLFELTSGHRMRLGADRFDLEVAAGKPLVIKAGSAKIEFDAAGNVSIEGNAISIKAKQGLSVEGLTADVKGTTQASLQALNVSVKGTATTAVEASGSLSLKGAMVAIN